MANCDRVDNHEDQDGKNLFATLRHLVGNTSYLHRSAFLALATKVTAAGLGFGTQILLARLLGAEEYGIYSYFWVWIMIGAVITSLGFTEGGTRFIAEYRDTKAFGYAWGFIQSSLKIVLSFSGIITLSGWLTAYLFRDFLPEDTFFLIILALACLPIFAAQDVLEGFALAFSWTGLAHIPPYILRQLLIIAFVGAAVWASFPATAETVIAAAFAAGFVAASCQLVIFFRRARKALPPAASETKIGFWFKTTFPMLMANGFQLCLTFMDMVILGFFVSAQEVALYFAATRISSQVSAVPFAVTSAVAQRMSGLKATNDIEDLYRLIHTTARWIFWPTLAVTIGILICGYPLLWMFGPEFTAAYTLLPILCLGLLARASVGGAEDALKMGGHERAEFAAKAGSTVLNLILNLLLIPSFGLYGAAIATSLSIAAYALATEIFVRRLIGTSSFVGTLGYRSQPR